MVTGIVVNDKLALSRPKRDMVRSMKHRLANGEVPHHEMNHVLGWINFANHVDRSNQTLPRSGPSVRPGRISFRKICLALDMVKEGGINRRKLFVLLEFLVPVITVPKGLNM